jgi:hypothetical protein
MFSVLNPPLPLATAIGPRGFLLTVTPLPIGNEAANMGCCYHVGHLLLASSLAAHHDFGR